MSENRNDDALKNRFGKCFKTGTAECALLCGGVAMALALLVMLLGFWKTLLVLLITAIGVFIGGVKDKRALVKRLADRFFPAKTDELIRKEDYAAALNEKLGTQKTAGTEEKSLAENEENK